MNRLLIFAFLTVFITTTFGCRSVDYKKYSKEYQQYHFDKNYRPLTGKIDIDGYWYTTDTIIRYYPKAFILYSDGTFFRLFFLEKPEQYLGRSFDNLSDSIQYPDAYSQKVLIAGGIYGVSGDTLSVEAYTNELLDKPWMYYRWVFEIIDKNTLRLFEQQYEWELKTVAKRMNILYHFVPSEGLPSPFEVMIKTEKWMWSSEEEWMDYRDSLKLYEKQRLHRPGIVIRGVEYYQ